MKKSKTATKIEETNDLPKLEVQYIPIDSVHPWDKNPKKHDIDGIIESMKRFKVMKPITIHKSDMMIVAGHGRYEAFRKLGMKTIPVILEDWLTDDEAKAYALVDNQTGIRYGWDEVMLKVSMDDIDLEGIDIDMKIFGFNEEIVKGLPDDAKQLWEGMPEFQMDNVSGRKIIMHFIKDQDVRDFAELIGQNITERTKYLWFPKVENDSRLDAAYGQDENAT